MSETTHPRAQHFIPEDSNSPKWSAFTVMYELKCYASDAVLLQMTKFSKQERSQASLSVSGRLNTHCKWKEQAGSGQSMLPHAASYVPWVLTLMMDRSIGYATYSQLCSMGAHLDGG